MIIKGIGKLRASKGAKLFRRIPGGKYVFAAPIAIIVYNNARADGLTVAQAGALAGAECVNPLPIGPSDLHDIGMWYESNFDAVLRAGRGELSDPMGGVGKLRKLQRELLDEQSGNHER